MLSAKMMDYLTKKQIDVLLKCYYLRKYTNVAHDENITPSQVKQIKDNGLRVIRLAYSKSYRNNQKIVGEAVLQNMAERSNLEVEDLSDILNSCIEEGLASEDKKYWERIQCKSDSPTPAELLDFLYAKYEIDIIGFV